MNEKLLERIRKLLGDRSDEFTDEQIDAAFKGSKFVDLTDGEYVSLEKFNAETAKVTAANKRIGELEKATDDSELRKQLEDVTADRDRLQGEFNDASGKLTRAERQKLVDSKLAHVPEKLRRVALTDAEALVTDTVDFAAALDKVIADDEDYAAPEGDDDAENKGGAGGTAKVTTGGKVKSGSGESDEITAAVDAVFADTAEAAEGKD